MRVTENTYQGPGASMMKPGMSSRELNDIYRSVKGPGSMPGTKLPAEENLGVSSTGAGWERLRDGRIVPGAPPSAKQSPEDNIRQLRASPVQATGDRPPEPLLPSGGGRVLQFIPNPAFGEYFNMEWDGQQWVRKDPNADLARQAMEMELEARRRKMDSESGVDADLKAWLANRLGSGR